MKKAPGLILRGIWAALATAFFASWISDDTLKFTNSLFSVLFFGSRRLAQNEKVVSWSEIPAGITFVDPSRRWCLVVAEDGIYAVRGLKIIIR